MSIGFRQSSRPRKFQMCRAPSGAGVSCQATTRHTPPSPAIIFFYGRPKSLCFSTTFSSRATAVSRPSLSTAPRGSYARQPKQSFGHKKTSAQPVLTSRLPVLTNRVRDLEFFCKVSSHVSNVFARHPHRPRGPTGDAAHTYSRACESAIEVVNNLVLWRFAPRRSA